VDRPYAEFCGVFDLVVGLLLIVMALGWIVAQDMPGGVPVLHLDLNRDRDRDRFVAQMTDLWDAYGTWCSPTPR
jgi:hypothetical protein